MNPFPPSRKDRLGFLLRPGSGVAPWLGATLVFVIGTALLLMALGPPVMIMAPWDVFLLLDGAWRLLVGQAPHTDFFNPIGPLTYYVGTVGMHIGGQSLMGLTVGHVLFLLMASVSAIIVAFRKLPAPWAFLLVAFLTILLAGTRSLGWEPETNSYAMLYNRYGWVLLAILEVQIFVAARDRNAGEWIAPLAEGMLIGLLFLCKITFFLVGAGAYVLVLLLERSRAWHRILFATAGFAAICFSAWLAIGFNPLHYLQDVRSALGSQSSGYRTTLLKEAVESNVLNVAAFVALLGLLWATHFKSREQRLPWLKAGVIVAYMILSAFFITTGNARERSDIPMFFIAALVLLCASQAMLSASAREWRPLRDWRQGIACLITVGFAAAISVKDLHSIAHSWSLREYRTAGVPASQRFASDRLGDFVIPHSTDWRTTFWLSRDLPAAVNDGLELLRRRTSSQDVLVVLGYGDPFSFALGRTAHKHSPVWWDKGVSYSYENHPRAERIFEQADHVMIPILPKGGAGGCCDYFVTSQEEIYGEYLDAHFIEVERSAHWRLLQRKT